MSKEFTFISRQFNVRQAMQLRELESETFDSVADYLYRLLLTPEAIYKSVIEKRDNILPVPEREGVIKFFYVEEGNHIPIARAERVMDFYQRTGKSEVYFFVDVIGGTRFQKLAAGVVSQYVFVAHSIELLRRPTIYGLFSLTEHEPGRFRLVKVVRDRYRRPLNLIIQPTPQYPRSPPIVVTSPSVIDPCFAHGGRLDWAYARGTLRTVWESMYLHSNPLIYLLDELFVKYRIAV